MEQARQTQAEPQDRVASAGDHSELTRMKEETKEEDSRPKKSGDQEPSLGQIEDEEEKDIMKLVEAQEDNVKKAGTGAAE